MHLYQKRLAVGIALLLAMSLFWIYVGYRVAAAAESDLGPEHTVVLEVGPDGWVLNGLAEDLVVAEEAPLPEDPFQRTAAKALRGDFGVLLDWQRCAYEWGLARGVGVCGVAKVTAYGNEWEPWESDRDCEGKLLYVGVCAANPELPLDCIVWISGVGLRIVRDRGGWVKVGGAWVRGEWKQVTNELETANLDVYTLESVPTRRDVQWARVKR